MVHCIISDPFRYSITMFREYSRFEHFRMVASESCIKGLGFDKGPCVTNLIVLNHSDWVLISFELTHGSGILSGL